MPDTDISPELNALDREIDLDIVSASWRSLTDSESYEDLLAAWDRKLKKDATPGPGKLVDQVLARQLGAIQQLLADDVDLRADDPLEAAIKATPAPSMVISPQGVAVLLGPGANEFYDVSQGGPVGREWLRPDSVSSFETILHSGGNASYAIVRVVNTQGEESLAEVFPLPNEQHDARYIIVRSLELDWYPEVSDNLSQAFGLTEAETNICRLLFQLREPNAIAKARGVEQQTIRTQLKSIFAKTEVRSKVELIRMLGLICARAAPKQESRSLSYGDPTGNERIIHRKDGRALAYTWTGVEDGEPILYVHGGVPYFMLHSPVREALIEHRLKLITLSLPGHGNSEPSDDIALLDDGAQAVIELCDHLGLQQICGLASYAGQICLSRSQSLRPDLFRAHLVIGVNWNLNAERLHRLPLNQRTLANLARIAPKLFELIIGIGFRRMMQEGPDFFLRRSFSSLEADRGSISDPELQGPLRLGCQHLANQGPKGFVQMQRMVGTSRVQDWMAELDIPIHFLIPIDVEHPAQEDIDDVRALGSRVTAEIVTNAGELLPYQVPELFIEQLLDLASRIPHSAFAKRDEARTAASI